MSNIPVDRHPTVQRAQAALDKAQLDLSYTTIRAAESGIVTKVDQLQVGSYVNASTPVFSMMSDRVWVEANFKETELTYMRPGQEATVEIDTYPGVMFRAKLASLSPGTGLTFSLLPAENATGNWVKVVQRLPVRLARKPAERGAAARRAQRHGRDRHPLPPAVDAWAENTAAKLFGTARASEPHDLDHAGDDHAGRSTHDRQCRAAAHAGQPVGDAGPDRLGADLLHRRRRDHDAADRLARRPLRHQIHVPASVAGFTLASALCGAREPAAAGDLPRCAGRLRRGLVPLSQATCCCSINPPSATAKAMAVWGMGTSWGRSSARCSAAG
jgi:hypothetical protein